jgi:glycosyltransferase involved in cell wall biosynthesis
MPRVSIIVPCRNEKRHVAAFASSALAQSLPEGWTLEVVVADGLSDDGTREALAGMAARDPRVQFVDNPGRIVSCGLNRALVAASGDVVVRMDVHTEYAPDYVAECLAALQATGADNVGGPWRAVADAGGGPTQAAAAAAFQSRWVAGGALSRRLDYDGPADTVYLGAWPRPTLRALRRLRRGAGAQPGRRAQPAHRQGRRADLAVVADPQRLPAARDARPGVPPVPAVRLLEARS